MTHRWMAVCGLLLVQLVLSSTEINRHRVKKVFLLPQDSDDGHVELLLEAMSKIGILPISSVEIPTWTDASRIDDYDLLWSINSTPSVGLELLQPRHKVNRLPGNDIFNTKKLIEQHRNLQQVHGKYHYNFIPDIFYLPQQKTDFVKAFEDLRSIAIFSDKVKIDVKYNRRWRVFTKDKSYILSDSKQLNDQSERIVKIIEPLLISGHKFQVGVYVVITSIDPLRVYVYNNVLLRMCKQKYPVILSDSTPREAYEVTDESWSPPWQLNDLRALYDEIPSRESEGTNHLTVLKKYVEHLGIDPDKFQRELFGAVTKTIVGSHSKFQRATSNHFEIIRFDFEVEDTGKPWLVGVNTNPSFTPAHAFSGSFAGLQSNVAHDLLQLVGINAPAEKLAHEILVLPPEEYCKHRCIDKMKLWDFSCWRCPGWFSSTDAALLYDSASEYARRGRFHLVFPTIKREYARFIQGKLTSNDESFHRYLISFAYDPAPQGIAMERTILCVNREQCSHHGNCMNGQCVCDSGYEGKTCYIPVSDFKHSQDDSQFLPTLSLRVSSELESNAKESIPSLWIASGIAVACYVGYHAYIRAFVKTTPGDKES